MNPFKALGVWYAKQLVKKQLKRESDHLRNICKVAPIPASVFGNRNILAHYGNPSRVGTIYALVVIDGIVQQAEQDMLIETAKIRFPDGGVELAKLIYARDHAPWK